MITVDRLSINSVVTVRHRGQLEHGHDRDPGVRHEHALLGPQSRLSPLDRHGV